MGNTSNSEISIIVENGEQGGAANAGAEQEAKLR